MPLPYEGFGLVGDKHAVVIDLGAAYTKCGFASELTPRAIVPSTVDDWESGLSGPLMDFSRPPNLQEAFLKKFLYQIYYKHLLVAPKERRLVLVESVLSPTEWRDMVARVLFLHLDIPSVLFAPAHLMATFPLATPNALVVDVGYSETLVLPVFESVPMLNCWEASPSCGGRAVHSNLRKLLLRQSTVHTQQMIESVALAECPELLTESVCEDIKARLCFVSHMDRGQKLQGWMFDESLTKGLPTAPPDVSYLLQGDKTLTVSGHIRESGAEVMFSPDDDEKSIPQLILDSLLKCPIDLRRPLAERILVVGGGAMLPGFLSRLKAELLHLVSGPLAAKLPLKSFKFYKNPCKENYAAWLGGSVFGALEVLPYRSMTREEFQKSDHVPDWTERAQQSPDENGEKNVR